MTRDATTFSKLGVQFLIVYGITALLQTKKIDRSTQFGAVGYIITLYSSKSYVKICGVCPNFGEVRTPPPLARPPVVSPVDVTLL